MRNLATIQEIKWKKEIEGKDRIEIVGVLGWQCITKKNEFQIGEYCIYVECDSVLPETEQFEFLRSKKFRIKTMKMAGVISQGICFPLSILPEGKYELEQDVTDIIGVKQYEATMDTEREPITKPATKTKYPKWLMRMEWFRQLVYKKDHREGKGFPIFISKTDESRVQNMPWILQNKSEFVVTEKIDGQSGTFALVRHKSKAPWKKDNFEYIVCSRNLRLWNKNDTSYWRASDKYEVESALKSLIGNNEWVAIQGECVASNVQGNKYKVTEPDLYVFNLIYPNGRVGSVEAKLKCEKLGMKFVPILDEHYILPDTVNEMLEYAHGDSALGHTIREGVVLRSLDGKQSFKAVDPLFLIKYDE